MAWRLMSLGLSQFWPCQEIPCSKHRNCYDNPTQLLSWLYRGRALHTKELLRLIKTRAIKMPGKECTVLRTWSFPSIIWETRGGCFSSDSKEKLEPRLRQYEHLPLTALPRQQVFPVWIPPAGREIKSLQCFLVPVTCSVFYLVGILWSGLPTLNQIVPTARAFPCWA